MKRIMKFLYFASIKKKIISVVMMTSGAVLILASIVFVVYETFMYWKQLHQELRSFAGIIASNTTAAITFGDRASAAKTLEGLGARPYIMSAYVLETDGKVFAKYTSPDAGTERLKLEHAGEDDISKRRIVTERLKREAETWWTDLDGDLEIAEQILLDDQPIGVVMIQYDIMELFSRLKWFLIMMAVILVITLGVAYLLSNRLQSIITRPILRLSSAMESVTREKNYSIRTDKESDDEIGRLIAGFNEMLARIQKRDEDLERFARDLVDSNEDMKAFVFSAAHDLRGPLVNLKGFSAELAASLGEAGAVLAQGGHPMSDEDRKRLSRKLGGDILESVMFIEAAVKRMDVLINAMLKLSRAGHRDMKFERVETGRLVRAVLESLRHQISENQIALRVGELPAILADEAALEQIFSNLLENAIKYVVPGRPVSIEIGGRETDGGVLLQVRDNGRGIAKDDLPKLFKMFRRIGTQDVPGEGVGLAYVKTLVRRHGGRIWCESEPGAGSTFNMFFPLDHTALKMEAQT